MESQWSSSTRSTRTTSLALCECKWTRCEKGGNYRSHVRLLAEVADPALGHLDHDVDECFDEPRRCWPDTVSRTRSVRHRGLISGMMVA